MLLSNLSKVIRVNKTYNFNKNKYFIDVIDLVSSKELKNNNVPFY